MIQDQLAQVPIAAIHFRRGDYLEKTNFYSRFELYKLAIEFLCTKFVEIKFRIYDRDWFSADSR